jgi:hypothetical protein
LKGGHQSENSKKKEFNYKNSEIVDIKMEDGVTDAEDDVDFVEKKPVER